MQPRTDLSNLLRLDRAQFDVLGFSRVQKVGHSEIQSRKVVNAGWLHYEVSLGNVGEQHSGDPADESRERSLAAEVHRYQELARVRIHGPPSPGDVDQLNVPAVGLGCIGQHGRSHPGSRELIDKLAGYRKRHVLM